MPGVVQQTLRRTALLLACSCAAALPELTQRTESPVGQAAAQLLKLPGSGAEQALAEAAAQARLAAQTSAGAVLISELQAEPEDVHGSTQDAPGRFLNDVGSGSGDAGSGSDPPPPPLEPSPTSPPPTSPPPSLPPPRQ